MLTFYRWLPHFKGKYLLGKILFKSLIDKKDSIEFKAHQNIQYKIPNTFETIGVELLINGTYEKKIVDFLNCNIQPNDVYFDIGANIGALSLPVLINKMAIKYVGFEASPMVFKFLNYNFKKNNIKNYELYNCVVHEDDNKSMKFYQSELYGKSSLAPSFTQEFIFVNSISLDSFCIRQKLTHINWIKIDVQGFELYVLKGLQQLLLKKKVANIIFEFEAWEEEEAGLEKGAAQTFLLNLGYELFDITGKKLTSLITVGRSMIWGKPSTKF